jgi:hypothetical protein
MKAATAEARALSFTEFLWDTTQGIGRIEDERERIRTPGRYARSTACSATGKQAAQSSLIARESLIIRGWKVGAVAALGSVEGGAAVSL